jgi:hypothetical protein
VGQILLASKKAQERTPLFRDVIADCTLQHGIRRFDSVENGALRHRTLHLNLDLVSDMGQRSKMLGKLDTNSH